MRKDEYNPAARHPMQSWEWGEARGDMGLDVIRVVIMHEDAMKSVLQLTLHPIPKTNKYIGYVPRSPWPSEELLQLLKTYAKERNIVYIRFEPDVQKQHIPEHTLKQTSQTLFTPWQFLLDITPSEEDLLKNMKPKTRYNIRLAEKKGVVVREESNEHGLQTFISLYLDTCKRQQYHGRSEAYLKTVWKHLGGSVAHILIASYQGKPLVAYMLFLFHKTLYYPYGGSSEQHRNLMPANLLMWEAIRFGKQHGATLFDMWGALGPNYDASNPWAGFTRFKEGYGGKHVEYAGTYDLVIDRFWYQLITALYSARQWMWRKKGGGSLQREADTSRE